MVTKRVRDVCAHCHHRPPRDGRVLCVECTEQQAEYKRSKVAAGLCRSCSRPREPQRGASTRCANCAAVERGYAKNRRPFVADRINTQQRERYWSNPVEANKRSKDWRMQARRKVYEAYGGARCACCGETEWMFLTLDHVNSDGHQFRTKRGGVRDGASTYLWAIKNGFPPGLQVLCYNCNSGRYRNGGVCPHQEVSRDSVAI